MNTCFQENKCKKNVLWTKVAEKLNLSLLNHAPVNADKYDLKWRNLWFTYKDNVKKSNLSGRDSVSWEYYDVIDEQFGNKPNVWPSFNTIICTINSSYTLNEYDCHSESPDTLDKSSGQSDNTRNTKHNISMKETRQESHKKLKTGYGMADYINLKKIELESQNEIQKKLLALKERGRSVVYNISSSQDYG